MELIVLKDIYIKNEYKNSFFDNGLKDFYSIYNYHSDKYYTKNPLRNVISFSLDGEIFFLKRHQEKFLLWPKGSSPAKKEWDNAGILKNSGFKTAEPVAYGQKDRRSFIITKKLKGAVSLEEYIKGDFSKYKLIKEIALLARRFHNLGYCHQDFYTGHIFIKDRNLYLIDVQRLLKKKRLEDRWRVKDIAQLNYSAPKDIISNTDRLRFLKHYFNVPKIDKRTKIFIKKVQKKTKKISRHTEKLIRNGAFS